MANGREFDKPATYEVRVKGVMDAAWASYWFEGFVITPLPNGESLLTGQVADQSALLGLLAQIRDLGLPILSIRRTEKMSRRIQKMEKTIGLEARNRVNRAGKGNIILRVILSVMVFSVFLKIDTLLQIGNSFVEWEWSAVPVLLAIALVRMIFAGVVVLAVLPLILGLKRLRDWLPGYLRIDLKAVLLGALSFVVFCILAAVISLGIGIFRGDLSVAFARPDLRPDPDVIGWGYFFLALVPGIWEELAFRGLILSKLQKRFSTTVSILLGAAFFSLFHFSNILTQAPSQVTGGVVMAFFFGIAWGFMTIRSRSVIPAMLSHYLVDSIGQVFIGVDSSNPALVTGFFLLLTLTFPVFNIVLAKIVYKKTVPTDRVA